MQRAWQEPVSRLLIFDNCEEEALLAEWLPKTGGCTILLTSRRGNWSRGLGVELWPLPPLAPLESVNLLRHIVPDLPETIALEIAHEVGNLPLALHLAGSFLGRYRQVKPALYLAQLRDKGLLHHPSLQGRGVKHSPTGHELNVARTLAINLDQLDPNDEIDLLARQILIRVAHLAPGEPSSAICCKPLWLRMKPIIAIHLWPGC